MYQQLKNPNTGITYTGGLCLSGVCDAFGTNHKYATAMGQWDAEPVKHTDLPPSGFSVPVFFSLVGEPAGHVAISLPDGRVASTTQAGVHKGMYIHPNLNNLISVYKKAGWNITYLGWGEVVGTQQVIKGDTMAIIEDADNWKGRANRSFQTIRGRDMGPGEFSPWVGQDFLHLIEALEDDAEANSQIYFANLGKQAATEKWAERPATITVEKPVEVIKEVVKEVPVEKVVYRDKIVEIVKGDDERTFGDLLSAAFKKLFKIK